MYKKTFENISIEVNKKGAELKSLKIEEKEIMWEGNENYWGKTSPVLFPFVGSLKEGKYLYKAKEYKGINRHGFARDMDFILVEEGKDFFRFLLEHTKETLEIYPFKFQFYITYKLIPQGVEVKHEVYNLEEDVMYFSLGAHPAFACSSAFDYEDFYIEFEKNETLNLYKLNGAFINSSPIEYLKNEKIINLTKEIFKDDALVFKGFKSEFISLKNKKTKEYIKVSLKGFEWLGLWAPMGAPFVCIEPWLGVADFTNHQGNLEDKVGINKLNKKEKFEISMLISLEK